MKKKDHFKLFRKNHHNLKSFLLRITSFPFSSFSAANNLLLFITSRYINYILRTSVFYTHDKKDPSSGNQMEKIIKQRKIFLKNEKMIKINV